MKVIIVTNQKEIEKSIYLRNQELKYLVVANENICFEEKSESNLHEQSKELVNLKTLSYRMKKLFGQDVYYEKIKEKLVGVTISYTPEFKKIFTELIKSSIIDSALQKYLQEKLDFFVEYMNQNEHPNFRTYQFYLSKMNILYNSINKLDEEKHEEFIKYVVVYTFKVCVCHKNGKLVYDWKGNEEYGSKSRGKADLSRNDLSLRVIDDFVLKSFLDGEQINRMLKLFEDEYVNDKKYDLDTVRMF